MTLYFLACELRKQRDYQAFFDELAQYSAVRILESLWGIRRNGTSCVHLRDHLKQFVDDGDGLIVIKAGSWASMRANTRRLR